MKRIATALIAGVCLAPAARGQILPENVLLLYNSQEPESQAVRDMYVAAHPGVLEFNLDDAMLGTTAVTRNAYLNRIRGPLRAFLNGDAGGPDISSQVIVIVTTRGVPSRINGGNEFQVNSTWAAVESELTLLQQDLEQPGTAVLPFRHSGIVRSPYHNRFDQPLTLFSRDNIKVQRTFTAVVTQAGIETWRCDGLTPGDMYYVFRLDAAPSDGKTALENIQGLIDRSQNLFVNSAEVQVLLDEYANPQHLDDDPLPPQFPGGPDFELTKIWLGDQTGFQVTHDVSSNFVTGPELADPSKPLVALATYGENHDLDGSENPPGNGVYISTYTFHPAAMFLSYESFNGNSIFDGTQRADHQQVLDFIAAGGSFTIGHIKEPFTFAVPDMYPLSVNMLRNGMTYAEAAYSAIPGISWQCIPVGDPLATITVFHPPSCPADLDGDGDVDTTDLNIVLSAFGCVGPGCAGDIDGDGDTDTTDLNILLSTFGQSCP